MVAFIVYDPSEAGAGGSYTVLRWGDCAPDDVASQGGTLTAVQVPADQMSSFLTHSGAIEQITQGANLFYRMTWAPATSTIGFAFGSATVTEVEVLQIRDQLLADSDWTQLLDAPLTPTKQAQWAVYRQALRDVPAQPGYPSSVTWPSKPS